MATHIKYPVIDGMKECGVCGLWKSLNEYKPTKTYYDHKCKSCRKLYAAEYRQRPEVKAHSQKYHKDYMENPDNRATSNARQRKYNKNPKRIERKNTTRREWAANEKQKAVDYKGGGCCICGYNDCLAALDFHHLDPSEKDGYGTGALKAHWSFEKNKPELDKCILVCVRCHREIHAGLHPEYLINGT